MHSQLWNGRVFTGATTEEVEQVIAQFKAATHRAAQRDALWGRDHRTQMTRLCWSFPTLVHADGVIPWSAERLLRWLLTSGAPGSGARHAAKFVLQVWNSETEWAEFARRPVEDDGLGITRPLPPLAPSGACGRCPPASASFSRPVKEPRCTSRRRSPLL